MKPSGVIVLGLWATSALFVAGYTFKALKETVHGAGTPIGPGTPAASPTGAVAGAIGSAVGGPIARGLGGTAAGALTGNAPRAGANPAAGTNQYGTSLGAAVGQGRI